VPAPAQIVPAPMSPDAAGDAADVLWARLQARIDAIADDQWSRSVASCPRWDVHDLVSHVAGLTTQFAGLPQPAAPEGWTADDGLSTIDAWTEAGVVARRGRTPDQQLEETAAARQAHVAALRALPDLDGETVGPTGPTTQRGLLRIRMFDLWLHLWDLHEALDGPADALVDAVADHGVAAAECHAYVASTAPYLFGRRAGAPEGAAVRLSLDAPLALDAAIVVADGRARWADPDAGTDRLSGSPAAFALVMTGRLDPARATVDGLLRTEGAHADRLLTARVF
jgi:uncharacterized protein (TIGR03083 family)